MKILVKTISITKTKYVEILTKIKWSITHIFSLNEKIIALMARPIRSTQSFNPLSEDGGMAGLNLSHHESQ